MQFRVPTCLLGGAFVLPALMAVPAAAQETAEEPAQDSATQIADDTVLPSPGGNATVFEPDYFIQFAPRNALDMLRRVPGFSIDDDDNGRGLGQASQNVIVNGERLASKSDSLRDQLRRIPADTVLRIEIVEGNSLDIPGLNGQVANILTASTGTSGQFTWRSGFRAYNTQAQLYGGEISVTGSSGRLDYTVALSNDNNRFGADGPVVITDAGGALIETQETSFSGRFDNPKLSTNFKYDFSDTVTGNLNLAYGEDYFSRRGPEIATPVSGPVRTRDARRGEDGPEYEIGADLEFPFGPGTMKLIGLERFERDNFDSQVVDSFSDNRPATGSRFVQSSEEGERIGRLEYGWNLWNADWQLSGEAAFNRLNRTASLFELGPGGEFAALDFDAGNGGVTEDRYEAILSYGKQLSPTLALQATGGAEYSQISQTGVAANARTFQRPKGSLSLSWKPNDDFDISGEIRRSVGQLSFGDFLSSVSLDDENQRGGNNELVPNQSWNFDLEVNKALGPWGSTKLEFSHRRFEDFIEFFPLPDGGEARGNIGNATSFELAMNTTLQFDPIGWTGARLEIQAIKRWMRVTDPFTGEDRPFSNDLIDLLELDLRHDVPRTDWAWGAGLFTNNNAPYSRRFETGRGNEGPVFANLFIEHKDVFGLTVNATYANVLGARNDFVRTVFDGSRPASPVLFREVQDRRIGPIFRFSVGGSF